MIVRPAAANDCTALAALDARCNPSPWSATQFAAALQNRFDTVLLAENADGLCGLIVWQNICGESELHLIATAPECRRQGIATRLMQHWFDHTTADGGRLFLEVRASNTAAQTLYRKYGFQECGRRKAYYPLENGAREDAVLMEKSC
ncbi:ribosomal protein S18-alanine N-acetyltransferase [Neisseria animalis]|uniref:[Ribosomal protein bS18]-alanine N-acetyltransferase n=1 Tax=Neisseria animalis TaxID=492 RepID=A0A5P3MRH7_NEIAN|nr:ribosomal protein S18-alanine N-acetyltransferase [Neisseria animalis]QEY24184.1 ribosomal-protein-alanine N-acetyltransferase [Neisseria animalis]ROW32207.1 ribosomal-protein-alanine N-acetyltransferase [Neisseria animalis]VEE06465.1 acetyltransferase [Neisseria animalis]